MSHIVRDFSLSDKASKKLDKLARRTGQPYSTIIEAAITAIDGLYMDVRQEVKNDHRTK